MTLEPDDRVTATGPAPKDPKRAAELLEANQHALMLILVAEQLLGATLK